MKYELIADIDSPYGFRQLRPMREGIPLRMLQIPRTYSSIPDGITMPNGASGVYFLLDDTYSHIYIGESYQVFTRYAQHPDISWWTHALCFFITGDDPLTEKERNWLEKELHTLDFGMEVVSSGNHSPDDMIPAQNVLNMIIYFSRFFGLNILRAGGVNSEEVESLFHREGEEEGRPTNPGQWAHEICAKFFDIDTEEKRKHVKKHFEGVVRQHITHYVQARRGECKPGERWKDRYRSIGILGDDGRTIPIPSFPWPLTFINNT